MRILYSCVVVLFVIFLSGAFSVDSPKLTEESICLAWMRKHSEMDNDTLLRVYNIIKDHPLKNRLIAMGAIESNFNPTAKSPSNARGIWQIIPKWWFDELKEAGIVNEVRDFWNIERNGKSVIYIMNKYTEQYGQDKALIKYFGHTDKKLNIKYAREVKRLENNLKLYQNKFIQGGL